MRPKNIENSSDFVCKVQGKYEEGTNYVTTIISTDTVTTDICFLEGLCRKAIDFMNKSRPDRDIMMIDLTL